MGENCVNRDIQTEEKLFNWMPLVKKKKRKIISNLQYRQAANFMPSIVSKNIMLKTNNENRVQSTVKKTGSEE